MHLTAYTVRAGYDGDTFEQPDNTTWRCVFDMHRLEGDFGMVGELVTYGHSEPEAAGEMIRFLWTCQAKGILYIVDEIDDDLCTVEFRGSVKPKIKHINRKVAV